MGRESLRQLIDTGKEKYQRLVDEATAFLRDFDILNPEGFKKAMSRRQGLIVELQEVQTHLVACCLDSAKRDKELGEALDEFRQFQETTTGKILKIDSLVIALAGERRNSLKNELAALSRGRTALAGYAGNGQAFRRNMNEIV